MQNAKMLMKTLNRILIDRDELMDRSNEAGVFYSSLALIKYNCDMNKLCWMFCFGSFFNDRKQNRINSYHRQHGHC